MRKLKHNLQSGFDCICQAVKKELSEFGRLSSTKCGSHVAFHLNGIQDTLASEALKKYGIVTRPLSSFSHGEPSPNGLMLGFGTFSSEQIEKGIQTIRNVLLELQKHS